MRFIHFNKYKKSLLYSLTLEKLKCYAQRGYVVLIGTVSLMHAADIAFIQIDPNIVRDTFDQSVEEGYLDDLDNKPRVIYFDNYYEPHINAMVKWRIL